MTSVPGTGFEIPVEVVVTGLVTGLTYSLLGVGLVLTYRTSRVLNFSFGQSGALAAGLVPLLVINHGVGYWLALLVALGVATAIGAALELGVIRRLAAAPRLIALVATIGAAQLLFVLEAFIPKGELGRSLYPTPFTAEVRIGSLRLGAGQLLILAVVPLVAWALHAFMTGSWLGRAARAAAENEEAALLAGVRTRRVSLAVWTIAGLLAGVAAVLVGPTRPVIGTLALGPQLLVRGLAAAMIGRLEHLPLAFAGGVGIGILELLFLWNYPTSGLLEPILLVVIVASLVLRRRQGARRAEESSWSLGGGVRALPPAVASLPLVRRLRGVLLVVVLAAASLPPIWLSNSQRLLWSSVAILAIVGVSLVVLTGFAGQISLGQWAFVGLGALVGGRLHQLGYPPVAALVYAMAAGGVVALLLGLPALRIRGLYLAVTTLAFAVAFDAWAWRQPWLVHRSADGSSLRIPRPVVWGVDLRSELTYYWVCLAALVAVVLMVHRLRGSGLGRGLTAVRDNEDAAAALSVSPRRMKLVAFVVSGVTASAAGYLYGGLLVNFDQSQAAFGPEHSLALVGLVVFGGITTVTGAVLGAVWLRAVAYVLQPVVGDVAGPRLGALLAGAGLLLAVLTQPAGMAAWLFALRDRVLGRLLGRDVHRLDGSGRAHGEPRARLPVGVAPGDAVTPSDALAALGVVVRYGGNLVVGGVSLRAGEGEIVGLIGPNGAGKTTLFDVLSGQVRPQAGRVLLRGHDITALRPEERARFGLGRTFQQARLFDDMAVVDVLKVALECGEPSEVVPSLLGLPPSRAAERVKDVRAGELVDLLGLGPYAHREVRELSTGTRRFVELGCVVAMGSSVVLLDEPTAGIAQREVEAFRPVLREIRDHLDATIVLIDHDLPMVIDLADRAYVLAAGQLVAEGPPARLRDDPLVVAAYLGADERVIHRSGVIPAATG